MPYKEVRKVYRQGGSLLVSLPAIWAEAAGIKDGSSVEVSFESPEEPLSIRPTKAKP